MTERTRAAGTTPAACPFLALEEDRDRRASGPDGRHRCYAQADPLPPSLAWQRSWCLAPIFSGCSIFLTWAARAAAPAEPTDGPRTDGDGPFDAPAPRPGTDGPATAAAADAGAAGGWAAPPPWVADPELRTTASATATPAPAPADPRPARADERPVRIPGERSGPLSGTFAQRRGADADAAAPAAAVPPPARPATRTMPPLATGAAAFPVPATPDLGGAATPVGGADPDDGGAAVAPPPTQGWLSALLARQQPDAPDPPPPPAPEDDGSFVDDDLDVPPIAAGRAQATGRPAPWAREAQPPGAAGSRQAGGRSAAAPRSAAATVVEGAAADDMGVTGRTRRVPIDMRAPRNIGSQAAPGRSAGSGEWNQPRASRIPRGSWREDVPAIVPPVAIGGAILLLVAVLLFLLPGFLAGGGSGSAPASPSPVPSSVTAPSATPEPMPTTEAGATLRSYKVQRGDNLIDIARRFGVELAQLICINPSLRRDPDTLYYGTILTIPPGDYICRKPTRQTRG